MTTTPTQPGTRILVTHFPKANPSYRALLVFLLIVGAIVLGFALALDFDFERELPASLGTALSGIYVAGVLLLGLLAWRDRLRRFHIPWGRVSRLDRLLAGPEAGRRFPHRAVERASRRYPGMIGRLHRVLRTLPPGTVVFANGPGVGESELFVGSHYAFEPIEVTGDPARMGELFYGRFHELLAEAAREEPEARDSGDEGAAETKRPRPTCAAYWQALKPLLARIWSVLLLCGLIAWLVFGSRNWLLLSYLALSLAFGYMGLRFWYDEYWLVPGGIVVRCHRPYRRALHGRFLTRRACAVYANFRSDRVWIASGRKVVSLPEQTYLPGFLVGWLSAVEPPSREQVCDFAGIAPERLE